jgi:hypothetical protein
VKAAFTVAIVRSSGDNIWLYALCEVDAFHSRST